MFTLPLTDAEYKALVDIKRQLMFGGPLHGTAVHIEQVTLFPELQEPIACATVTGWALLDGADTVLGWHWVDRADIHWTDESAAAQSFVPDRRRRDWLLLRQGYRVMRDDGHLLVRLLESAEAAAPVNNDVHTDR